MKEKWELLKYIADIVPFSVTTNNGRKYLDQIKNLKEFFSDIDNSALLIDVLISLVRYYEGEFKESLSYLQNRISLDESLKLASSKKVIDQYIHVNTSKVYKYGNEFHFVKTLIEEHSDTLLSPLNYSLFFTIGAYDYIEEYGLMKRYEIGDRLGGFFSLELLFNSDKLDLDYVNKNIKSKYKKEHLSIMQLNYIKAKMGEVDEQEVKKLVVVNPYSFGIKNLMLAFVEKDPETAQKLYLTAINNLEHIKYYYVEAILYYSIFLKEGDFSEYNTWFDKGIKLAKISHYRFLIHKFECLKNNDPQPYTEEKYPLNINLASLKK